MESLHHDLGGKWEAEESQRPAQGWGSGDRWGHAGTPSSPVTSLVGHCGRGELGTSAGALSRRPRTREKASARGDRRDRSALRNAALQALGSGHPWKQVTGTSCPTEAARDPRRWNSRAAKVNGSREKFSALEQRRLGFLSRPTAQPPTFLPSPPLTPGPVSSVLRAHRLRTHPTNSSCRN